MRDRLIELINNLANGEEPIIEGLEIWSDAIADYLLANGVVVIDTDVVSLKNRPLITQCFGLPLDEIIERISEKKRCKMTKITCTCWDCKFCNEDSQCTAEEIKLTSGNISTVWEGRQDVWWCKSFEMSKEAQEIQEKIKLLMKGGE